MIAALRGDAWRLLIRPRTLAMIAAASLLCGFFVRATHHSHASEIVELEAGGALLGSLGSVGALLMWIAALVLGIVLANEDRSSGLIGQLAIRPVSRVEYAVGRVLGLGYATSLVGLVILVLASLASGVSGADLPLLQRVVRASSLSVEGHVIAANDVATIDRDESARFEFPSSEYARFAVRFEPRVKAVASAQAERFSGFVSALVTIRPQTGEPTEVLFDRVRPLGNYEVQRGSGEVGACTVEIVNRTVGATLTISREQLIATGLPESSLRQVGYAVVLLLIGSLVVAAGGFLLATTFSVGTAVLVGCALLLIGISHSAVYALVVDASATDPSVWLSTVRFAIDSIPDLGRFDASDRLANGDAITALEFVRNAGIGVAQFLTVIAASSLLLSWRDR